MKVREAIRGWLVYEFQRVGFRWDSQAARYRDNRTGRFVAETRILDVAEGFAEFTQLNMERATGRYLSGAITLIAWQGIMRQEIKDAHLVASMAGRGGRDSMTQGDWGRAGARLRQQYGYLDNMTWERFNGTLSDAQMLQRAQMYSSASRTAYYDGKTAAYKAADFRQERRRLNPAEHCQSCVVFAGLGWQPIGTLPPPGQQSECLSNCKCTMEFRTAFERGET